MLLIGINCYHRFIQVRKKNSLNIRFFNEYLVGWSGGPVIFGNHLLYGGRITNTRSKKQKLALRELKSRFNFIRCKNESRLTKLFYKSKTVGKTFLTALMQISQLFGKGQKLMKMDKYKT